MANSAASCQRSARLRPGRVRLSVCARGRARCPPASPSPFRSGAVTARWKRGADCRAQLALPSCLLESKIRKLPRSAERSPGDASFPGMRRSALAAPLCPSVRRCGASRGNRRTSLRGSASCGNFSPSASLPPAGLTSPSFQSRASLS